MRLKAADLRRLRPPEVRIGERLLREALRQPLRCVRVRIRTRKGPCTDDWCETISFAAAEWDEDCSPAADDMVMEVEGFRIIMDGDLYYSASKMRDKLQLDVDRRGHLTVDGFSSY